MALTAKLPAMLECKAQEEPEPTATDHVGQIQAYFETASWMHCRLVMQCIQKSDGFDVHI